MHNIPHTIAYIYVLLINQLILNKLYEWLNFKFESIYLNAINHQDKFL